MCDTITVFLHQDGKNEPIEVTVNKYDPVRSLLLDCSDRCIIFKNGYLCEAFSFSFYQIENGSHIYSQIKQSKNHKKIDRNTRETDGLRFRKCQTDMCLELDKLKDRFFNRVEGSFRVYKRVLNRFDANTDVPRESPHQSTESMNWNFETARKPSTVALPMV